MNKIKTTEPKVLWKLRCKLGEGTLWVKEHNSIYFVDIKKKYFFSLNTKNNKKKKFKVDKEIGFLAKKPISLSTLNFFFLLFFVFKEKKYFFLMSTK